MATRKNALVWSGVVLVVLVVLYVGAQVWLDKSDKAEGPSSVSYTLTVPDFGPDEQPKFEEAPVFTATQGDTVVLAIKSDVPGEAHLHGYEKEVELQPGGEVKLTVVADKAGRFPIHFHDTSEVMHHMATLEIRPR